MSELDKEFLKDVFKEINSHIRATERKSLIITGAYIAFFSVLLSMVSKQTATGAEENTQWLQVAIQAFFLIVGSCIYVMQQWYRAWKEHYIDVCLEIRKQFLPNTDYPGILPYWLQRNVPESRMSIDNLLKHLTASINFVIVFVICYELLGLISNQKIAILLVAILILTYIGLIYLTDKRIQKSNILSA
ncbi:MAG: hypothetical protein ABW094_12610 [Candidatus Thiodiazotropha sp.]